MKKYGIWIFILFAIVIVGGFVIYLAFSSNQNVNNPSSNATRMSTNVESRKNNSNTENHIVNKEVVSATEGSEKEIATFSTKILDEDNNRDHNMELSLAKLNGTVVEKGSTFSFNKIVGSPTPDKGYEKAGVFVEDEYKKDYGGGNCQVSTTLYNAVLKVKDLEVTERHEHTQEVYYVKKGKDAAVAYGELDLKFKNNTKKDIKIHAEMTEKEVKIKLTELS